MRKIVTGGVALTVGLTTALATGAFAGGNGAERSGVSPQSGSMTGQCEPGSGSGSNGFVIFNAPGNPAGTANKLIGELSLKNATPNTTYMVAVSVGANNCMPEGTLTTNGVGNGNTHIADSSLGAGTFYIVLSDAMGNEVFASAPVTVK